MMLEAAYILIGMCGLALFATGFFVIIPEIMVDSTFDLLTSLLSPRRMTHVLRLVEEHIRDNWPETKPVGYIYYSGASLLALALILYCIDEILASF